MVQFYSQVHQGSFGTVNDFHGNNSKYSPASTQLLNGNIVVTWYADDFGGMSGLSHDIFAQLFTPAGVPLGGAFKVNEGYSGTQQHPEVVNLPGGGFVIVWQDSGANAYDPDSGSTASIKAQIFDEAGAKVGSELVLGTDATGHQTMPAVMASPDGFWVAWSDWSTYQTKAQQFNAAGEKLGGEILLVAAASSTQAILLPQPDGGFLFARYGSGIKIQLFDAQGAKSGAEVTVAATTLYPPSITYLSSGNFVVSWTDTTADADGSSHAVRAQLFSPSGEAITGSFVLNTTTAGAQYDASIQALPDGGFVAVWNDQTAVRNGGGVVAQVFSETGGKVGSEFLLPGASHAGYGAPVIVLLQDGQFAVVTAGLGSLNIVAPSSAGIDDIVLAFDAGVGETSPENGVVGTFSATGPLNAGANYSLLENPSGAFAIIGNKLVIADASKLDVESGGTVTITVRATDLNGNSIDEQITVTLSDAVLEDRYRADPEFTLNATTAGDQAAPQIASLVSGSTVAVWNDNGSGAVRGTIVGLDGIPQSEFLVTAASIGDSARVTGLSGGGFVVTWTVNGSGKDVFAQVYDAAGLKVGGAFSVHANTAGDQTAGDVVGLAGGGFAVIWHQSTPPSYDDYMFTGTPVAIVAQAFNAQGGRVGGEVTLASGTSGTMFGTSTFLSSPQVTALQSGDFMATWHNSTINMYSDQGSTYSSFGQVVTASGGLNGATVALTTWSLSHVATLSDGRLVGIDLNSFHIFSPEGALITSGYLGLGNVASVSALATGGFVVTGTSGSDSDGRGSGVFAQTYDPSGAATGSPMLVNDTVDGNQWSPAVSLIGGTGQFIVVWRSEGGDGEGSGISARTFSPLNYGPRTGSDTLSGTEDTPVVITSSLLLNDMDPDADELTIVRVFGAAGEAVRNEDGSFTYTPPANASGPATISYVVSDGRGSTGTATVTLNLAAVNDDPRVALDGDAVDATATYSEGGDPVALTPAAKVGDIDSTNFADGTLTLLASLPAGEKIIIAGVDPETGAVTVDGVLIGTLKSVETGLELRFNGNATPALVQALLRTIAFQAAGDDPTGGTRKISYVLTDGDGGTSTLAAVTVTVQPVNDVTDAKDDEASTDEATAKAIDVIGNDVALDGPDKRVTHIQDIAVEPGGFVILDSGAKVTLELDGKLTYDPNNAFNGLTDASSGGTNLSDTDSFTYTEADGDIATVQVTIQGISGSGDVIVGDASDNTFYVTDSGTSISENPNGGTDTVNTSLGSRSEYTELYVIPANVENLNGTSASGQGVRDNALDNVFEMGAGDDLVVADQGGADKVKGNGGDDFLYFGATWSSGDEADGGEGYDTVGLLGSAHIGFGADDLTSIEQLSVYSSGDTLAPNSYDLTMNDANVAAGETLRIQAASLAPNETLTFDGSAELDGKFLIRSGRGADTLTGGAMNDNIDGDDGNDIIDGGAGKDWIVGGAGADTLTGGFGQDTFVYNAVADSSPRRSREGNEGPDRILDFELGVDKIHLRTIDADGDGTNGLTAFSYIGNKAFSGKAGELSASFDADGGYYVVQADIDGDSRADLTIYVTTVDDLPLSRSDFLL